MNKDKALATIAQKQRDILALTERLHNAGHESTLTHIGEGSAVVVLIGKQLDPFQLATEQAWINVTGATVPISPEFAQATREVLETTIRNGIAQHEIEAAEEPLRKMVDG